MMSRNSLKANAATGIATIFLGMGLAMMPAAQAAAAPEPTKLPALDRAPDLPVGSVIMRRAFPDHPVAAQPDGAEAESGHCDKTVDLTSTLSGVTATAALDTVICTNADIDTYERDGSSYVILAGGEEAAWTHIDVTDPANPVMLGQFSWNDGAGQTTYTPDVKTFRVGASDYVALALERFSLLAFCGVVIYDVSDPANPVFVSQYIGDTATQSLGPAWCDTHNVFVENDANGDGQYIYATADSPNDLRVLDIADVANPVEVGRYVAPTANINNYVHDVTVLDHGGAVGRRAYLSYWDSGLVILDAADITPGSSAVPIVGPLAIDPGGFLTHHAWASQDGTLVFIQDEFLNASGNQPVQMWDVTNPAAPAYVDGLQLGADVPVNPAHNLEIRFDLDPGRLYVGWYKLGLQAWDFTAGGFDRPNPAPRTASAYHQAQTGAEDVYSGAWGVRVADIGAERYVFQSDRNFGLIVNCESCAESFGGALSGTFVAFAACFNVTTSQFVTASVNADNASWDCEAAGLTFIAGDTVAAIGAGGVLGGADPVGGSISGATPFAALCDNLTLAQQVTVPVAAGETSWDCEAGGLSVSPGDIVRVIGVATAD